MCLGRFVPLLVSVALIAACSDNVIDPTSAGTRDAATQDAAGPSLASGTVSPSGSWMSLSAMPTPRVGLAAAVLNGSIYALGGADGSRPFSGVGMYALSAVEAYDPLADAWATKAPMLFPRVYPDGAAVLDGRIYVPGGAGCDHSISCGQTNTLQVYDPAAGPTGTWTEGPSLPAPSLGGTSSVINGELYVSAGVLNSGPGSALWKFSPVALRWTELTGSPGPHAWGAAVVIGGKLYLSGGEGNASALDVYDPATDSWISKTMPVGYQHHAAVAVNGSMYLVGGVQFTRDPCCPTTVVMGYDPSTDTWTTGAPAPTAGGPYAGSAGLPIMFAGSTSNTLSALPLTLNLTAAASVGRTMYVVGGGNGVDELPLDNLVAVSPPDVATPSYLWNFGDGQSGTGQAPTHTYAASGTYTVSLSVSTPDGRRGSAQTTAAVTAPVNRPPVADPGGPYSGNEGSAVGFEGGGSADPDGDALGFAWDFGDGSTGTGSSPTHTYAQNGSYTARLTVTDTHGASNVAPVVVAVANVAPTVTAITLPLDPIPVNTAVSLSSVFTDPGVLDSHSATIDWEGAGSSGAVSESNGSGTVVASHVFTTPGVYSVAVTVADGDGGSGRLTASQYVVVYDPSGGFVTGGGWISSPSGALSSNPNLSGKATFGFNAKYQKGASEPSGSTEFDFHVGNLDFQSTSYQWLVVAGSRAQYKGSGSLNGVRGYGFLLTAIDGQISGGGGLDRLRMKIWDGSGVVVYDNQPGSPDNGSDATALGAGSIVIHQ